MGLDGLNGDYGVNGTEFYGGQNLLIGLILVCFAANFSHHEFIFFVGFHHHREVAYRIAVFLEMQLY